MKKNTEPEIAIDANIIIDKQLRQDADSMLIMELIKKRRLEGWIPEAVAREVKSGRIPASIKRRPAAIDSSLKQAWDKIHAAIDKDPNFLAKADGTQPSYEDLLLAFLPASHPQTVATVSRDGDVIHAVNWLRRQAPIAYDALYPENFVKTYVKSIAHSGERVVVWPQDVRERILARRRALHPDAAKAKAIRRQVSLDQVDEETPVEVGPATLAASSQCNHTKTLTRAFNFRAFTACVECGQARFQVDDAPSVIDLGLWRRFLRDHLAKAASNSRKHTLKIEEGDYPRWIAEPPFAQGWHNLWIPGMQISCSIVVAAAGTVERLPDFVLPGTTVHRMDINEQSLRNKLSILDQIVAGQHDGDIAELGISRLEIRNLLTPEMLPKISGNLVSTIVAGADPDQSLTSQQKSAIHHAFNTPEGAISIINGPPGTGKSLTVAHLLATLHHEGKSVLLVTQSKSALGVIAKFLSDLFPTLANQGAFALKSNLEDHDSVAKTLPSVKGKIMDIRSFGATPIIGTTLFQLEIDMGGSIECQNRYDYVIIDEAGFVGLPGVLAGMLAGRRLILVGDPHQLPPYVSLDEYRAFPEITLSAMELIQANRPDLSFTLDIQHRSIAPLLEWSKMVHYDGKLDAVRARGNAKLALWNSTLEAPLTWVDTGKRQDGMAATISVIEALDGQSVNWVCITTTRGRAASIREKVKQAISNRRALPIGTVDGLQGHEADVVVFDLGGIKPTRMHSSPQRLNVAMSRAAEQLIVVGPRQFSSSPDENILYWAWERRLPFQVVQSPSASAAGTSTQTSKLEPIQ